eukprot:jgi/Picsp_1/1538/NSC_05016-R1_serine threonine-protein kinase ctr1
MDTKQQNEENEYTDVLSRKGWGSASKVITMLQSGRKFQTLRSLKDDSMFIEYRDIRIIKKIGEGAFAIVHLAEYNGQQVALKVLREEHLKVDSEVETFLDEIRMMKKLKHPSIVELIGMGGIRDDKTGRYEELFVVTEVLKGGAVQYTVQNQMITLGRRLYSLRQALTWCQSIASALEYLHNNNPMVVHRDLKLENVILTSKTIDEASAKLVDFGLAALVEGARNNKYSAFVEEANRPEQQWSPLLRSKSRRVESMMEKISFAGLPAPKFNKEQRDAIQGEVTGLAGSYGYMAPEVFKGKPYNEKADIFSFGVLMYNLCYRVIPSLMIMSNGDTEDVIVYAKRVSEGFRQPLNDEKVPLSMNSLIASCWHGSPEARPSAAAIVKQISEALEKEDLSPFEKPSSSGCCGDCVCM